MKDQDPPQIINDHANPPRFVRDLLSAVHGLARRALVENSEEDALVLRQLTERGSALDLMLPITGTSHMLRLIVVGGEKEAAGDNKETIQ